MHAAQSSAPDGGAWAGDIDSAGDPFSRRRYAAFGAREWLRSRLRFAGTLADDVGGRCHNAGMRLWFAPSSEVPIYRQLVTQVVLAILSGDLRPGDRLPSTRELARRFGLHPNTISAGYRQLEKEGWTEGRHGSGVYVRA